MLQMLSTAQSRGKGSERTEGEGQGEGERGRIGIPGFDVKEMLNPSQMRPSCFSPTPAATASSERGAQRRERTGLPDVSLHVLFRRMHDGLDA
jgi:hypothetical protein